MNEVGEWLSQKYAESLVGTLWEEVDYLIPVPIRKSRHQLRGYNQSERIAHKVSETLGIPILHALGVSRQKVSQTRLSKQERQDNLRTYFHLNNHNSKIQGKHVAIVDDVITTGATIQACIELLAQHTTRVSVLVLATADRY